MVLVESWPCEGSRLPAKKNGTPMPVFVPMFADVVNRAPTPQPNEAVSPVTAAPLPTPSRTSTQPSIRKSAPPKPTLDAGSKPFQDPNGQGARPCIVGNIAVFKDVPRTVVAPTVHPTTAVKNTFKVVESFGLSTKDLKKDIKKVSKHVRDVRVSFQGVRKAMFEIGFPGDARVHLSKEWTNIETKFNGVLRISGESAAQGYEAMSVFLTSILPCLRRYEVPAEQKLLLLKEYKTTVCEGVGFAQQIWDEHEVIQNKITHFKATCSSRTESLIQELRAKVSHTENNISGLKNCFQRLAHGFTRVFTQEDATIENALKNNSKVLDQAEQARRDINALGCVWKLFLFEIRGLETSLGAFDTIAVCPWMSKDLFEERLKDMPGRYTTLQKCLQLYAEAVSKP